MAIEKIVTLKREVTAAEAVTLVTGAGLVFSVVYNFGFFSSVHGSFVALLSLQDLIVGAAAAFIPTAMLFEFSMRFDRWVRGGTGNARLIFSAIVAGAVVAGSIVLSFFWFPQAPYIVAIFLGSVSAGGLISDVIYKRHLFLYFFVFSTAWSAIYSIGQFGFMSEISGYKGPEFEVTTSSNILKGKIIRETSNYTFVFDGTSVTMVPNSTVISIKKAKVEV